MDQLKSGEIAEITGYKMGNASYRAKLLALGLTHGVKIKIVNVAPLGDPFEIAVRGYHLSLRRDEVGVVNSPRDRSVRRSIGRIQTEE